MRLRCNLLTICEIFLQLAIFVCRVHASHPLDLPCVMQIVTARVHSVQGFFSLQVSGLTMSTAWHMRMQAFIRPPELRAVPALAVCTAFRSMRNLIIEYMTA